MPGLETDQLKETPLFSRSYNDVLRGGDVPRSKRGASAYTDLAHNASMCAFAGRHIQPAGTEKPCGRRDMFGRSFPPAPRLPHKYAGNVPGRDAENVHGERQCKGMAVSKHLRQKNKIRETQR